MKLAKRSEERKVYRVQTVSRAMDILDCFSTEDDALTLTELSRMTGLNKSTATRLLSVLRERGYLTRNMETGRYSLGMKLFLLGGLVFASMSLRKAAAFQMSKLQEQTSATVLLGVLMDDQLVYVDKREGTGTVRIASDIGWRRPPHYGMLGMVLMSSLPRKKVTALLKRYPLQPVTSRTIIDTAAFRKKLDDIAKRGYVVEYGEAVEGVIGVAAPIRDYSRKVVAAIGLAVLEAQHDKKSVRKIVTAVRSAAKKISRELGYVERK